MNEWMGEQANEWVTRVGKDSLSGHWPPLFFWRGKCQLSDDDAAPKTRGVNITFWWIGLLKVAAAADAAVGNKFHTAVAAIASNYF